MVTYQYLFSSRFGVVLDLVSYMPKVITNAQLDMLVFPLKKTTVSLTLALQWVNVGLRINSL